MYFLSINYQVKLATCFFMYDSTRKVCEILSFIWPKLDCLAGPSGWCGHIGLGLVWLSFHFRPLEDDLLAGERRNQTLAEILKLKYVVTRKLRPWRNFFLTCYFESLKHKANLNRNHSEESYIHHKESTSPVKQAYQIYNMPVIYPFLDPSVKPSYILVHFKSIIFS